MIGFFDDDYVGISFPHIDALIITLTIANHNGHQILVDNGSSADILYWPVFEKLKIRWERITSAKFLLIGFAGEQVQLVGYIELPGTVGIVPR